MMKCGNSCYTDCDNEGFWTPNKDTISGGCGFGYKRKPDGEFHRIGPNCAAWPRLGTLISGLNLPHDLVQSCASCVGVAGAVARPVPLALSCFRHQRRSATEPGARGVLMEPRARRGHTGERDRGRADPGHRALSGAGVRPTCHGGLAREEKRIHIAARPAANATDRRSLVDTMMMCRKPRPANGPFY